MRISEFKEFIKRELQRELQKELDEIEADESMRDIKMPEESKARILEQLRREIGEKNL